MSRSFDEFFQTATQQKPLPYQRRLAEEGRWPARVEVPTGLGKTLAVVVGWLWRRRAESAVRDVTPRRLVYCLPMRVLVEQTRDVVKEVVARLSLSATTSVVILMGGVEDGEGWDTRAEEDAIIIGTQDMLLSRALNRGYGMSRYRWPLHFGLLNNDCQWIIDEVQLVGTGVATTAQLQALRRNLGTALPTHTSWMSATLEDSWLRTVDVDDADLEGRLALEDSDRANPVVSQRIGAPKALAAAQASMGDTKGLAREILSAHRPGTRSLVIVNTVERARDLFKELQKGKSGVLFRPPRASGRSVGSTSPSTTSRISATRSTRRSCRGGSSDKGAGASAVGPRWASGGRSEAPCARRPRARAASSA